jgi:hypothetical protein
MQTFIAGIRVKGLAAAIQVDAKTTESARNKINKILEEIASIYADKPIKVSENDIERI